MQATVYNLETGVNVSALKKVPQPFVDATVDRYKSEGLIGKLHVTSFGKLMPGIDPCCQERVRADWEISVPLYIQETMNDLIHKFKLTTSGYDGLGQEVLEMAEQIRDILSQDPSFAGSSLNDLFSQPIDRSREFITPLGWQAANLFTADDQYFRFFKPAKESNWYNIDILKGVCRYWKVEKIMAGIEEREPKAPKNVNIAGLEEITEAMMLGQFTLVERINL